MKAITINDYYHGTIESVSGASRAYSVPVYYIINIELSEVEPVLRDHAIRHCASAVFTVAAGTWPDWRDVKFHDSDKFNEARKSELAEAEIIGSAHDYQDEQDAKAAAAQASAFYDKPAARRRAIQLLFKKGCEKCQKGGAK